MSNSIDFYKGIIFHVISVRIIVPWYDHAFVWWIPVVDLNTYGDHELVTSRKQAHDHNQWTTRRLPQLRKISWVFTANPSYLKSFQWYSESEFIVRLNTIFSYTILILRSSLLNPLCNAQELRHHPHFQVVKRSHLKVCYSRVTSRVTCRVCHKRQNICIEFFKQSIIKKMVGSVGRIEIQTFICKKHIHWFCLFMVGKNIIQIANMCGSSSWTVLVQANSRWQCPKYGVSRWSLPEHHTSFLTIYARNRFVSLFAFFAEWFVVKRCICVVETIVNTLLFDSGVILPIEHFRITIRVYLLMLKMWQF